MKWKPKAQNKAVILVSGKLQSGKNTFSDLLKAELTDLGKVVVEDKYAQDLKDLSVSAFKSLAAVLKGIRNQLIQSAPPTWSATNKDLLDKLILKEENFYEDKTDISRVLLQVVGTDIGRFLAGDDIWVDRVYDRTVAEDGFDVKIITDVRFPNEIEVMSLLGDEGFKVISIRVERELDRASSENQHESETALDDWEKWDYVVDNNGTVNALRDTAKLIARAIVEG